MTGKQLEEARSKTPYGTKEYTELSCISMMHSILVYNYSPKQEIFHSPLTIDTCKSLSKRLALIEFPSCGQNRWPTSEKQRSAVMFIPTMRVVLTILVDGLTNNKLKNSN